jgi:hypothetical protein
MTDQQLYFALGVPVLIYLFGFTVTVLMSFWQVKEIREDIRGLRTAIDLIMSKISDLDTRVAVLEERAR